MSQQARAGRAFVEVGLKSNIDAGIRRIQIQMRSLSSTLLSMSGRLGAVGAVIAAPLAFAAKQVMDLGGEMNDMSQRTGIAATSLQALKYAAEQTGTGIESVEKGVRKMQQVVAEARRGAEGAINTMDRLGVSVNDLAGLSQEEQFSLFADRLSSIEDPGQRAAAAMAIFGKGGTALLPMLSRGADGLKEFQAEAKQLGIIISDSDIAAADAFGDQFDQLHTLLRGIATQSGAALLGTMSSVVDVLKKGGTATVEFIANNRSLVVLVALVAAGFVTASATAFAAALAISAVSYTLTTLGVVTKVVSAGFAAMTAAQRTFLGVLAIGRAAISAYRAGTLGLSAALILLTASQNGSRAAMISVTAIMAVHRIYLAGQAAAVGLVSGALAVLNMRLMAVKTLNAAAAASTWLMGAATTAWSIASTIAGGVLTALNMRLLAVKTLNLANAASTWVMAAATTAWTTATTIAGVVTGGLSTALGLLTGATSATAVGSGIMSAAYTAAMAAMELATLVFTGGIWQLVKIVGGVIAVLVAAGAAGIVVKAGWDTMTQSVAAATTAWSRIKAVFQEVAQVAVTAFGGIKDALAAGQYMLAAKILWAGLKVAFWIGVRELMQVLEQLPEMGKNLITRFAANVVIAIESIFRSIPEIIASVLSGANITDAINSVLQGIDFLGGMSEDRIRGAKSELAALTAEAAKFRAEADEQNKAKAAKEAKKTKDETEVESKQQAIDDRIESIHHEIRVMKMGQDAADRWAAKIDGATETQLLAMADLQSQRAKLKLTEEQRAKAADALVGELKKMGDLLASQGVSPDQIVQRQSAVVDGMELFGEGGTISAEGATKAREAIASQAEDRKADREREAEEIREAIKTPMDKFNESIAKIDSLQASGNLTKEEAAAAREKATTEFSDETKPKKGENEGTNSIATYGSQAALDTLRRSRGGAVATPEWIRPVVENARAQLVAARGAPAAMAAALAKTQADLIDLSKLEELSEKQVVALNLLKTSAEKIVSNTASGGIDSAETVSI